MKKKAVIVDCAGIGAGEIVRTLRINGLDCAGYDEKLKNFSESCNEPRGTYYSSAIFVSDKSNREMVNETYVKSYKKYMPVLSIDKEEFTYIKIGSFLRLNQCAEWDIAEEIKRRIGFLRERIGERIPVIDISGRVDGLYVGAIMNEVMQGREKRFVYFEKNGQKSGRIQKFINEFEDYTGEKVMYADITNQLKRLEKAPPEFAEEFLLKREEIFAQKLFEIFGEKIYGNGNASGQREPFDGTDSPLIYMPYSAHRHPWGYLPKITPTAGLFEDELKEGGKILGVSQTLADAWESLKKILKEEFL